MTSYPQTPMGWAALEAPRDEKLLAWLDEVVGVPWPDLGRPGPLCPFVPTARRRGTVLTYRIVDESPTARDMLSIADEFLAIPPTAGTRDAMYKCALLLLPACVSPEQVAETVAECKHQLLEIGLTCGEFHPASQDRSARNPGLRVAQSPQPLIALRYLHSHDELFIASHHKYGPLFRKWKAEHD